MTDDLCKKNLDVFFTILDDSLLDMTESDYESTAMETDEQQQQVAKVVHKQPQSCAGKPGHADPPPKGRGSEKNTVDPTPQGRGNQSINNEKVAQQPVVGAAPTTTTTCKGNGYNANLYNAIKKLRMATLAPRQLGSRTTLP